MTYFIFGLFAGGAIGAFVVALFGSAGDPQETNVFQGGPMTPEQAVERIGPPQLATHDTDDAMGIGA